MFNDWQQACALEGIFHAFPIAAEKMSEESTKFRYDQMLRSACLDHDPWSRPYLETYRPRFLKLYEAMERYLDEPKKVIADIGCHNGFFLRLASTLGFEQFVAVDYFSLPDERSFLSGLNGTHFLNANFNEDYFLKPIADKSLDVVVSTEVIEHVCHHPLGYLRECFRVLRPRGLLLLCTPNPCTLANAARLIIGQEISMGSLRFAETPKLGPEGTPVAVWDIHFREYTQHVLREMVGKLDGSEVIEEGFLASSASSLDPLLKRLAKSLVWRSGLGGWRPLCVTQYMIVRRR